MATYHAVDHFIVVGWYPAPRRNSGRRKARPPSTAHLDRLLDERITKDRRG
jgi:hypothetical protein